MTSATLIERCCLIANPVAGNPTHYIIEQAFAHRGLDWRFMTFEVEPPQLGDAIRGIRALGFRGVKIAEPFHETVIEYLDQLTDRAKRCGSVNVITAEGQRLIGDNTEGAALVELVRRHVNPIGVTAMIVGAGRLARAIAVALAEAGVAAITVVSRSEPAGKRLVELIQAQRATTASLVLLGGGQQAIDADVAMLVNATSLGTDDPAARLPLDTASFDSKLVVADVAYGTSRTWLTRQAAERGCRIIEGVELYVEQTAAALRAWTDDSPDVAAMREAAEEFLGI
ncbi:MAG: shikimate dehydrogenase [Pirellulales bacterium]